ncbi:MAG: SGNH/GDSL hydrolase family protein [Bacteroidetes bacterium]|jgi:hypothetical protein|nr:SGNH/GDSL hydrolase family protein [Bacteroidota bacterium]
MASSRGDSTTDKKESPDKTKNYPRLLIVWASLVLILPSLTLFLFSVSPYSLEIAGISLKKYEWQNISAEPTADTAKVESLATNKDVRKFDSLPGIVNDSNFRIKVAEGKYSEDVFHLDAGGNITDSTRHNILLIGDSEAEGLVYPLNDYCIANKHKLLGCVKWYSASIYNFAKADTIVKIVRRFNPSYIIIVVGLNEIYARDLKEREKAAKLLIKKLQGRPYCWIGPANWVEDFGINNVFARSADPGTYYWTKKLKLPRAGDGRHPNVAGYKIWMDSVAKWLTYSARWPLKLTPPSKRYMPLKCPLLYFNAVNYRGY